MLTSKLPNPASEERFLKLMIAALAADDREREMRRADALAFSLDLVEQLHSTGVDRDSAWSSIDELKDRTLEKAVSKITDISRIAGSTLRDQ